MAAARGASSTSGVEKFVQIPRAVHPHGCASARNSVSSSTGGTASDAHFKIRRSRSSSRTRRGIGLRASFETGESWVFGYRTRKIFSATGSRGVKASLRRTRGYRSQSSRQSSRATRRTKRIDSSM